MTTADYLAQLQQDRKDLVVNLETKGITLTGNETFTELVPEVLNIPSGSAYDWSEIGYSGDPIYLSEIYDNAHIILKNWDAENPHLFTNDQTIISVPTLDMSWYDTHSTAPNGMFFGCTSLKYVSNTFASRSYREWFRSCTSLSAIDISNFSTSNWVLGSVGSLREMFSNCTNLIHIEFGNFETFDVTKTNAIYNMFYNCNKLDDYTLDGILRLCILVTNNIDVSSRKLSTLGITNNTLLSIIPTLPNYNDFISAGWSLN